MPAQRRLHLSPISPLGSSGIVVRVRRTKDMEEDGRPRSLAFVSVTARNPVLASRRQGTNVCGYPLTGH
jgi:hypothetical protein